MAKIPITFPSEASQLRQLADAQRAWTPDQRLRAVADALAAAEALSLAGGRRAEQLRYHELCEQEGRERMKAFILQHVESKSPPAE